MITHTHNNEKPDAHIKKIVILDEKATKIAILGGKRIRRENKTNKGIMLISQELVLIFFITQIPVHMSSTKHPKSLIE